MQRQLLVVSGGKFTLTVRDMPPGQRSQWLYRFRLRTRAGWNTVQPGVMEADIMLSESKR